jgi:hypothetical protein
LFTARTEQLAGTRFEQYLATEVKEDLYVLRGRKQYLYQNLMYLDKDGNT